MEKKKKNSEIKKWNLADEVMVPSHPKLSLKTTIKFIENIMNSIERGVFAGTDFSQEFFIDNNFIIANELQQYLSRSDDAFPDLHFYN